MYRFISPIIVGFFLGSCDTYSPVVPDSKRLTEVYLDTELVHRMEYDSQLRMKTLRTYRHHYLVRPDTSYWRHYTDLVEFGYAEDRLTRIEHEFGYDVVEYNGDDRPTRITRYTSEGVIRGEYLFEYDDQKRLISYGARSLQYGDRNVMRISSRISHDVFTIHDVAYDDRRNPFQSGHYFLLLSPPEYFDFPHFLSGNNLTRRSTQFSSGNKEETLYQYGYDGDGYPAWRKSGDIHPDTLFFIYTEF